MSNHLNHGSDHQPSGSRRGISAQSNLGESRQAAAYVTRSFGGTSSPNPTYQIPPTPYLQSVALPEYIGIHEASGLIAFWNTIGIFNWLYTLGLDLRDPNLGSFLQNNRVLNRVLQTTATLPEVRQLSVRDPWGFWGNWTIYASNLNYVSCMDVVIGFWRYLRVGLTVQEYDMDLHIIGPASANRMRVYGSHGVRRVDRLGEAYYLAGFVWDDATHVMTAVLSPHQ